MWRKIVNIILLIVIGAVILFNIFNLMEAYGSGPPYYSRTTNMDKWKNPLPMLLLIDVAVAAVATLSFIVVNKRSHKL